MIKNRLVASDILAGSTGDIKPTSLNNKVSTPKLI